MTTVTDFSTLDYGMAGGFGGKGAGEKRIKWLRHDVCYALIDLFERIRPIGLRILTRIERSGKILEESTSGRAHIANERISLNSGVKAMFPITAKAVANYFLERANQEKQTLSPMKIQKLVYYAHGWYLGLAGKPLIDEEIQAWPYGPVIQSLYHEFKHYGNGPITDFATDIFWKYERGDEILNTITIGEATESITPRMPEDGTKESNEAILLLDKVWRTYSTYSAIQLSNSTHEKDSPWGKVFAQSGNKNPKSTIIPKDVIQEHFGNLARK